MSERSTQLHATADEQIAELSALISGLDEGALRLPCPARAKLGDGTIGALIRHTADNYTRIAAFVTARGEASATHAPAEHGGEEYTADSVDPPALAEQLAAARRTLGRIGELSDAELDAVPPSGSFRFCDGKRTVEEVLRGLLNHQAHQLAAITAARA